MARHHGTCALNCALEIARNECVLLSLYGCNVAVVLQEQLRLVIVQRLLHLHHFLSALAHVLHFQEPRCNFGNQCGVVGVGKQRIGGLHHFVVLCFASLNRGSGVEVRTFALTAHAVHRCAEVYVMFAEHMVSLSIGRHQIFDGTLPVGLGVVVLHVPGIVGHTIQCHLRCLGILHGVARKCRHFGTKGVVALVVAVELAHEHVADAIVVNRIVQPDKRCHTVGGRLKEVQVALVNHVGHTGTSPHYLNALAQSVAQAAQIGIGIVIAGISGVVLCRTH